MKKKTRNTNPEQKTKNGVNNSDFEFGKDYDPVKEAKARNSKKSQPIKSKQRPE